MKFKPAGLRQGRKRRRRAAPAFLGPPPVEPFSWREARPGDPLGTVELVYCAGTPGELVAGELRYSLEAVGWIAELHQPPDPATGLDAVHVAGPLPDPGPVRHALWQARRVLLPPPPLPPVARIVALALPIGERPAWWLQLRCEGCRSATDYPLKLLAERIGGDWQLAAILPRLRCHACRSRPVAVVLTDDPAAGAVGGKPATWRLPLLP